MISIAPSILSADFAHLAGEIEKVEQGGADLLHVDVMDGRFVPNLTIGPAVVSAIHKVTRLPLDVHLMIEEPSRYIDDFVRAGASWISIHAEADRHLHRTIKQIQEQGVRAGVALNPATPVQAVEEILPELDYVLIMSVNPGFGGQQFIRRALGKIRRLRAMVASSGYRTRIEVDGGIGFSNLTEVLDAGADMVVAGSAVFNSPHGATEATRELRQIAQRFSQVLQAT